MLGMVLIWQLCSGLILVIFYTCDALEAFARVEYVIREVNRGWLLRIAHLNGARLLFIFLYLHMGRGLLVGSWRLWKVWRRGMLLFVLVMGEAFLGYVLPWGQMSVWGACVITRLLRVVPFIGEQFVMWIWGGFVVNRATLGCLFMLHYLLPLVILGAVMVHLFLLHEVGSRNRVGRRDSERKVKFFPFYILKDLMNLVGWGRFLIFICWAPLILGDCENLKEANLISRPVHIQPEWYFLFLYAILRAVPNKLGGVVLLAFSLFCIWIICFSAYAYQGNWMRVRGGFLRGLAVIIVVLTFLGSSPVEPPFVFMRQLFTFFYFIIFVVLFCWSWRMW